MHILFAYAAPAEAGSLPEEHDIAVSAEFVMLGVGKSASAFQLSQRLSVEPRPNLVVLFGLCGAHAGDLAVGDVCLVERDCLADEGVQTEEEFLPLADLGLDTTTEFAMDQRRTKEAAALLGGVPIVRGSTVSTCSGNDAAAAARASRTAAQIETMEGAAVALVCDGCSIPFIQLRCVSNRTGDRQRAGWDLTTACANLQDAVRQLLSGAWQQ